MEMWIQLAIRSVLLFFVLFLLIRLMGKKSIFRVTPFHFVSYIVIAVLTALLSVNIITNVSLGVITLGVWIILPIVLDYLSLKSKWIHDVVNGKPLVLIKHGKIMEDNLLDARLTAEELLREIRSKKVFNLADVEFAVMEDIGDVNVFTKAHKNPVSSYDLGIKVAPVAEPQTVVLDGNVLNESLASLGLTKEWLGSQLVAIGVSIDNVFLGQVDSSGELYLDLFDDAIQIPQPKVKEMLYANFEKLQADLMGFALETEDETAKKMYEANGEQLTQLMEKIKPYLLR